MLLNAQQLALEILSNMCCPEGKFYTWYAIIYKMLIGLFIWGLSQNI